MAELGPGVTRVTPTRRLAHWLRRRHDDQCRAQGLEVWRTPDIVTWAEFVERLFTRDRQGGRLQGRWLPDNAARMVWERIVRRDPETTGLVTPGPLGRSAHRSWQLMHAYGIPQGALRAHDGPESAAFARWVGEYVDWLNEEGWVDPALVVSSVGPPDAGSPLEFVGFDALTLSQEIFQRRMEQAGTGVAIRSPDPRRGETRWLECQDQFAEWEAAARWAAWRLDREPGTRLAIVVPGLHERRADVRRVIERVIVPQATLTSGPTPESRGFELAAAGALADRSVVVAALDLIDSFAQPLDLTAAGRLLRNSFLPLASREADARARLDAYVRRHEDVDLGVDRLIRLSGERGCPGLERALRSGLTHSRTWPSRALPSQWSRVWFEMLAGVGWPGENLDSDEHQARQRWQSLLAEFGACDDYAGILRPGDGASLLRDMADSVLFEPQELQAPLLVIDPETCAGMTFDGLWVCGLDAGRWPAPAMPDPFLPRDWQVRNGVPGATADMAAAAARRTLERLRHSADEVILSVPSFDDDAPLLPSALLNDVPRGTVDVYWDRPSIALASFTARPALEDLVDDRMPACSSAGPTRGGSYLLQLQAACPFRAQAESRLGARALEDTAIGLDAAERGDLLHAVMARIWRDLREQSALRDMTAVELGAVVRNTVAAETRLARESAGGVMRHLLEIESAWLEARVMELLGADLARPPFAVESIEQALEATLGGIALSLRLDRVDRLDDGSVAVIDYKTGADADVEAWLGERPKLPQLPLYAEAVGSERVAAVVFGRVRAGDTGYRGLARDAGCFPGLRNPSARNWPREFASWDDMLQAWRRRLGTLAAEYAAGDARLAPDPAQACRYCHLAGLCRIGETRPSAEIEGADDD